MGPPLGVFEVMKQSVQKRGGIDGGMSIPGPQAGGLDVSRDWNGRGLRRFPSKLLVNSRERQIGCAETLARKLLIFPAVMMNQVVFL